MEAKHDFSILIDSLSEDVLCELIYQTSFLSNIRKDKLTVKVIRAIRESHKNIINNDKNQDRIDIVSNKKVDITQGIIGITIGSFITFLSMKKK